MKYTGAPQTSTAAPQGYGKTSLTPNMYGGQFQGHGYQTQTMNTGTQPSPYAPQGYGQGGLQQYLGDRYRPIPGNAVEGAGTFMGYRKDGTPRIKGAVWGRDADGNRVFQRWQQQPKNPLFQARMRARGGMVEKTMRDGTTRMVPAWDRRTLGSNKADPAYLQAVAAGKIKPMPGLEMPGMQEQFSGNHGTIAMGQKAPSYQPQYQQMTYNGQAIGPYINTMPWATGNENMGSPSMPKPFSYAGPSMPQPFSYGAGPSMAAPTWGYSPDWSAYQQQRQSQWLAPQQGSQPISQQALQKINEFSSKNSQQPEPYYGA
jgi:hypothetical protein